MWQELLRLVGTVIITFVGGWLAIDKITHENRAASEREARVELVKRFVSDPEDLNDVFRAITLLVRTGMLADLDGKLAREVEAFFGQKIAEVSLGNVVLSPLRPAGQVATVPAPETAASAAAPVLPLSLGDALAQRVTLLNASTPSTRTSTVQQIITAIRDNGLPLEEQVKVAGGLVELAQDNRIRGLSATGRYNLIYVLSEIPSSRWTELTWTEKRDDLRRALVTLEARASSGATNIGSDTRRFLDTLKARIEAS